MSLPEIGNSLLEESFDTLLDLAVRPSMDGN